MGKVRDEAPAKAAKPAAKKGGGLKRAGRSLAPFAANLARTNLYKPTQGKQARLWTGVGLGAVVAAGVYRLHITQLGDASPGVRYGIPALLLLALGWVVFRVINYPPFADFLIATEAEMNKVSWTSKADLYRATKVVLATVLILAVYLFLVDWLWSVLLQWIGVLRVADTSGLGGDAGG
jgi:preprotein translocase subunit SecE